MIDDLEVDRDAIIDMHRFQNLTRLTAFVEAGEMTEAEAVSVHKAFMRSDALQTLVAIDVATVEAMLSGQVH
ncbi:hypothetical protein [Variovorax ginsengisoli]|uniref:Uncharacterized protein n=1 Tax=Variovorax ginsengisoli TaxID=363844 RepID=A0ABT8S8N7_9BURK|nr:hypothetical protein [Variovorax ginsengisoli]MDN8615494.1 hypothetical protein [Variovorax ginsengisoli]MDO1534664.1 hypothetical protein [Variovorax ginsengisoli]